MPLTRNDLERIREIVRDELARAGMTPAKADCDGPAQQPNDDDEITSAREMLSRIRAKIDERRKQPIPDGRYVDTYAAARLADVMPGTIGTWVKQGKLSKGKLSIDRAELDELIAQRSRTR